MTDIVLPGLERRLKTQLLGEVQFDRFTRGRYATDASHYQMMPIGVVAPRLLRRPTSPRERGERTSGILVRSLPCVLR
jgi:hypothetical protein